MKHITTPYLPKDTVGLFISDVKIEGATIIEPYSFDILPPAIRRHADLGIVIISDRKAVCPPQSCAYYKNALSVYGFEIIAGKSNPDSHYPKDSAYNVGIVGKKCFLNTRACDEYLYEILINEGYEIIDVKQGYAKCSICPIDENTFITGDCSIYDKGAKAGMDVLLISNEKILLPGFSNGFFGGCCGMGSSDTLLVNGDIDTLTSGKSIREFLSKKNIEIKNLREGAVLDIGSVLPLMTK